MKPEIFLECYCVARKKPIKCEITKPQERKLFSLWSCGLLASPDRNTINIPELFQEFTVFPVAL